MKRGLLELAWRTKIQKQSRFIAKYSKISSGDPGMCEPVQIIELRITLSSGISEFRILDFAKIGVCADKKPECSSTNQGIGECGEQGI